MEFHKRQDQSLPERKGQKRKLEADFEDDREISAPPTGDARDALLADVTVQVEILDSNFSWREADRAAAKRATHVLAELAKNGRLTSLGPCSPILPCLAFYLSFINCDALLVICTLCMRVYMSNGLRLMFGV